jgi:hypothetical protein
MKTINNNNSKFPKPFRFTIYLIVVTVVGFMNWISINANDPSMKTARSLESRLAEALIPVPEQEPELEDWILSLSDNLTTEIDKSKSDLETRLADALEPVEDPEPELEDWIMNLSDDILSGVSE